MNNNEQVVFIFSSVHFTLKAETCLKSAPWSFMLIPVPPFINQGCGLGIKISSTDQQAVEAYLKEYNILPTQAVTI